MALPDLGMDMVPEQTALVIIDPQNDFLRPKRCSVECRRGKRHREPDRRTFGHTLSNGQRDRHAGIHFSRTIIIPPITGGNSRAR